MLSVSPAAMNAEREWRRGEENGWEMGLNLSTYVGDWSCVSTLNKAIHLAVWPPCASSAAVKDPLADERQR